MEQICEVRENLEFSVKWNFIADSPSVRFEYAGILIEATLSRIVLLFGKYTSILFRDDISGWAWYYFTKKNENNCPNSSPK